MKKTAILLPGALCTQVCLGEMHFSTLKKHVFWGLTYLRNEHSELVQISRISIHYTQFSDPFVELECPFEGVFQGFVFLKESCIFR